MRAVSGALTAALAVGACTGGAVMAADLEGKGVTALARAQRDPRRVALDATHVYWLNRGTQGVQACTQHDGSVMRIAKPW